MLVREAKHEGEVRLALGNLMWMHSSLHVRLAGCGLLSSSGQRVDTNSYKRGQICERMHAIADASSSQIGAKCSSSVKFRVNYAYIFMDHHVLRQTYASTIPVADIMGVTMIGAVATLIFGKQLCLCSATGVSALVPTMCLITVCEPGSLLPINGRATPGDVRCQCNT